MESDEVTIEIDDRYARLRLIAWWNQHVLTQARVMVVGAGALGNEVLKNLALLGVGLIYIVDKDSVETANLSRSVLFRAEDVGQPKALVAAQRVREINPDVQAIGFQGDIGLHVGLGTMRSMQIIIGCLDNLESRRILNLNCWRIGRPWVDAAIDALNGYVRVISPAEVNSGCYECTLTEADYRILNERAFCPPFRALPDGRFPTTPTSAAILGAMQSQEAMKWLHGLPVRAGYSTYYSGTTLQTRTVQITRRPDCPAHFTFSNVAQLSASVMAETTTSLLGKLTALWGESVTLLLPREVVTSFSALSARLSNLSLLRLMRSCPRVSPALTASRSGASMSL